VNIAVTGSMGGGKSFVAEKLAKLISAEYISCDLICRKLLEPGQIAHEQMRQEFSADFFMDNGELNRSHLRKEIFTDALLRQKIDDLLHPLVHKDILNKCKKAEKAGDNLVLEIPLLFEKGWEEDFDMTLVVSADDKTCIKRIVKRDRVSSEDARKGVACQMPLFEKCKRADMVIDNSGSFTATLQKLEELQQNISTKNLFIGKRQK
jgi:dephospho-CoA kinase